MSEAKRLQWPSDAVMIVCASPTNYRREDMDSVHDGECRHCGAAIVYDGRTFCRATEIAGDRRVDFFCQTCSSLHDLLPCLVELRP